MAKVDLFIYGVHPEKRGHDLYTFSNSEKKDRWKSTIEKIVGQAENPAGTDRKVRIFYILRKQEKVLYSYVFGGEDSNGRPGLLSYNLILDLGTFRSKRIDPIAFESCINFLRKDWDFGKNYRRGKIPSLTINRRGKREEVSLKNKKRSIRTFKDPKMLAEKSKATKKTLSLLLGGNEKKIRLVCEDADDLKRASIACELFSFLPYGRRNVSYTTGESDGNSLDLIVSKGKPLLEDREVINLTEDVEFVREGLWDEITNYAVDAYREGGLNGVRSFHQDWKKFVLNSESVESAAHRFYLEKRLGKVKQNAREYMEASKKAYLPDNKAEFLEKAEEKMEVTRDKDFVGFFLLDQCEGLTLQEVDSSRYRNIKSWWKSQLLKSGSVRKDSFKTSEQHLSKADYSKAVEAPRHVLKKITKINQRDRFGAFKNALEIFLKATQRAGASGKKIEKELQGIVSRAGDCEFTNKRRCLVLERMEKSLGSSYSEMIADLLRSTGFCDVSSMTVEDWSGEKTPEFLEYLRGEDLPPRYQIRRHKDYLRERGLPAILKVSSEDKKADLPQILRDVIDSSEKIPDEEAEEAVKSFMESLFESLEQEIEKSGHLSKKTKVKDSSVLRFISSKNILLLLYLIKKHDLDYEDEIKEKIESLIDSVDTLEKVELKDLLKPALKE